MLYAPKPGCEGIVSLGTPVDAGSAGIGIHTVWHPSSNYVCIGSDLANKQISIYSFDGTSLTEVETVNLGSAAYFADWHPNGNFLAVGFTGGNAVKVYSWNGTDTLSEVESVAFSYAGEGVSWHPNGNFLAAGHASGGADEVTVYSWNGSDTLTPVETVDLSGSAQDLAWSHDGNYLAVGTDIASEQLKAYSWNGSDTLTLEDSFSLGGYNYTVAWSLSDSYIFTGAATDSKPIVAVAFDGSSLTEATSITYGTNIRALCSVSIGGNYLLVGTINVSTASSQQWFKVYYWNEGAETLTIKDSGDAFDDFGAFCPSVNYKNTYYAYGKYALGGSNLISAGSTNLRRNSSARCIT